MRKIIKIDFSKKGRELREITRQLRKEKSEPLSIYQKIGFIFDKQANESK